MEEWLRQATVAAIAELSGEDRLIVLRSFECQQGRRVTVDQTLAELADALGHPVPAKLAECIVASPLTREGRAEMN